jgi:hypothetical protein
MGHNKASKAQCRVRQKLPRALILILLDQLPR